VKERGGRVEERSEGKKRRGRGEVEERSEGKNRRGREE
jgi:hypothetical protein